MAWEFEGHNVSGGLRGPDPYDPRDRRAGAYRRALGLSAVRPESASLLEKFPPIYDQGNLGACVSFAFRAAREYLTAKVGHGYQPLSPLWLYYNARAKFWPAEVDQDTGLYMRDGVKIIAGSDLIHGRGFARDADWPYDIAKFAVPPPAESYGPARWYANVWAYRVESLSEALDVLAAGWPIAFGFTLRASFWLAKGSGNVPMPSGFIQGGHAVCASGYKYDSAWQGGGYLEARNSWGKWTVDGNLRFPFAFFETSDTFPDSWALALRSEEEQPPDA